MIGLLIPQLRVCVALSVLLLASTDAVARQSNSATPPRAGQSTRSLADVVDQIKGSVFTLKVYAGTGAELIGTGTAWALSERRLVTNWHVVRGASKVVAVASDGSEHVMSRLVVHDADVDLAVIQGGSGFRVTPLTLASQKPRLGEVVFVLGSPRGLEQSLSDGIVSGIRSFGETEVLQITAAISPGSSGSPVCCSEGRVVGVAAFSRVDGQGLNFAIPVGLIPAEQSGMGQLFPLGREAEESQPAWITSEEIHSLYDAFVEDFFSRPGYLRTISFDGSDRKCGVLGESVRVFQVLGPSHALIEVDRYGTLIRLSGLRMDMVSDGQFIKVVDLVCAQISTYRYETVNGGSNTVPDVVVLDMRLWEQAKARRLGRIDNEVKRLEDEQRRAADRVGRLESEIESMKASAVGRAIELQEKIRLYRPAEHQPEIYQMIREWRRELDALGHINALEIARHQERKKSVRADINALRDLILTLQNDARALKAAR